MIDRDTRGKLFLLTIPVLLLMVALGFFLVLSGDTVDIFTSLVLTFLIIINIFPFAILLIVHYYRTKRKSGPLDYSFYTAFFSSLVVMVIASFLILREERFARPGSQLSAYGFVLLPFYSAIIMLVGYLVGVVVERILSRQKILQVEDYKKCRNFFKKKTVYVPILVIVVWTGIRSLPRTGFMPLPNIHMAAEMGVSRQVKRFLDKGIDINAKNKEGETPLHLAMFYGGKSLVEFLITNGAQVNAKANNGETPLHIAAHGNDVEMITILLKYGADINAQDNFGDTPLREAARRGCTAAVEYLIKNGADVNIKNKRNQTPIFEAVWYGYDDIAKLLLDNGAEIDFYDANGRSPLSISIEEKCQNIEHMLRNRMKDSTK